MLTAQYNKGVLKPIYRAMDSVKRVIRSFMRRVAQALNFISAGRITPNSVTIFGLLMHVPIAYLIATGDYAAGAILLIIFGLFDTLDGELARIQNRVSNVGMILDASTDRFKEVFLYTGAAYTLSQTERPEFAAWAVAACGFSISVSYIKAKGESAVSESGMSANDKNKALFRDGLLPFEVRMFVLVVGLLTDTLLQCVAIIAVLSAYTALERLIRVVRSIRVQD